MKKLMLYILCMILFGLNINGCKGNDHKNDQQNAIDIVIIDVMDKDIAKYGKFPWPRDIHGAAVSKLNELGATGVLFDMIFSEPDEKWPEKDSAFSSAIRTSKIPVFMPYVFVKEGGVKDFPYSVKYIEADHSSYIYPANMQVLPVQPLFMENAAGTGFLNAFLDKNDILKDIALALEWKGKYYPFIGLSIAAHFFDTDVSDVYIKNNILHIGNAEMKIDNDARLNLPFHKPFQKFKHYAYSDLLERDLSNDIEGKFVIMGYNATGLSDYFVTTSSNRFPGTEVHAAFLNHVFNRLASQVNSNPAKPDLSRRSFNEDGTK